MGIFKFVILTAVLGEGMTQSEWDRGWERVVPDEWQETPDQPKIFSGLYTGQRYGTGGVFGVPTVQYRFGPYHIVYMGQLNVACMIYTGGL